MYFRSEHLSVQTRHVPGTWQPHVAEAAATADSTADKVLAAYRSEALLMNKVQVQEQTEK